MQCMVCVVCVVCSVACDVLCMCCVGRPRDTRLLCLVWCAWCVLCSVCVACDVLCVLCWTAPGHAPATRVDVGKHHNPAVGVRGARGGGMCAERLRDRKRKSTVQNDDAYNQAPAMLLES